MSEQDDGAAGLLLQVYEVTVERSDREDPVTLRLWSDSAENAKAGARKAVGRYCVQVLSVAEAGPEVYAELERVD
jgi:hypothetical protein